MFAEWSNKLFDEFIAGEKTAVVSEIVLKEISKAQIHIQDKIKSIPSSNIIIVEINCEIENLADSYINAKIVSSKSYDDALHIACATFYNIDIQVSWNFKHIVNYNRITLYNSINLLNGFKTLEIRNPKEVLNYEQGI
jgi:predicted nucleic acid-binding protein